MQAIPLPFTLFLDPRIPYEHFWNGEHIRVYEVHSCDTVSSRNQIVQRRWQLGQAVKRALADNNKTTAGLTRIKGVVQAALREASVVKKICPSQLVDLKGQPTKGPKGAVRLRMQTDAPPSADTHWMAECNSFLHLILDAEECLATPTPQPQTTPQTPKPPPKQTITDFSPPISKPQTPLSEQPPPPPAPLVQPQEGISPVFGEIQGPAAKLLSAESDLVTYVDTIAEVLGITATGALDRILHETCGSKASTFQGSVTTPSFWMTPPLDMMVIFCLPLSRKKKKIAKMLWCSKTTPHLFLANCCLKRPPTHLMMKCAKWE